MSAASSTVPSRSRLSHTTRRAALACIALFGALALIEPVFAQAVPDAISGTWSGRIGRTAEPNYAITLELRLDGTSIRGGVSTADGSGQVRNGSYDPASGMLHLEIARAGQDSVALVLDGTQVKRRTAILWTGEEPTEQASCPSRQSQFNVMQLSPCEVYWKAKWCGGRS